MNGNMRTPVITLQQPWATMIAEGFKTIETRAHSRFQQLIGRRVAIHAGKTFDRFGFESIKQLAKIHDRPLWGVARDFPKGEIICTVVIVSMVYCGPKIDDTQAHKLVVEALSPVRSRYLYGLRDVVKLDRAIPAKGHLGIWYMNNWMGGSNDNDTDIKM